MQREQVLKLCGQIENEMDAIGLVGTSGEFESWLLREYLPSLHEDKPLPDPIDVHDKAMRAWVKYGPEDDGPKRVLDLLYRLDRTLELAFEVKRFGYFDSAVAAEKGTLSSSEGRALVTSFTRATTHYVTWQIELAHPDVRKKAIEILIDWDMTLEDGTLFGKGTERLRILPDWKTSWIAKGWGWETAGNWKAGRHRTQLRLWRSVIVDSYFVVA